MEKPRSLILSLFSHNLATSKSASIFARRCLPAFFVTANFFGTMVNFLFTRIASMSETYLNQSLKAS